MTFNEIVAERLPGTMPAEEFVSRSHAALSALGFTADNTIACVATCRDELCRSLADRVQETWGEAFNFSSLGGMLLLGRTGFVAAQQHAPIQGGRERHVYFAMPHLGIGADGELGWCERVGRPGSSTACGALAGFRAELESGILQAGSDPTDLEMSLLRARLLPRLRWGQSVDLLELTRVAHDAIREDLERMLNLTIDGARADHGVLTGILVHEPGGKQHVWPRELHAVVGGRRVELTL